jgi:hypothetical protein
MSLFTGPEEHVANPPETWIVERVGNRYALRAANGATLDTFERKRDAEDARHYGFIADLYAKEARWYAGELVHNWKPYAELAR